MRSSTIALAINLGMKATHRMGIDRWTWIKAVICRVFIPIQNLPYNRGGKVRSFYGINLAEAGFVAGDDATAGAPLGEVVAIDVGTCQGEGVDRDAVVADRAAGAVDVLVVAEV
jgi:hypothetical protein